MRILTRYILKEVSSHALLGVLLFTFILFMRDLGRLLELVVRNSAPLPSVGEIFLYTLPTAFMVTLPMGVLVGILIGLSRWQPTVKSRPSAPAEWAPECSFASSRSLPSPPGCSECSTAFTSPPKLPRPLTGLQNRLKTSQASFEVQPRVFYEEFKNNVLYVQDAVPSKGQSLWRGVFLADVTDPSSPTHYPR